MKKKIKIGGEFKHTKSNIQKDIDTMPEDLSCTVLYSFEFYLLCKINELIGFFKQDFFKQIIY